MSEELVKIEEVLPVVAKVEPLSPDEQKLADFLLGKDRTQNVQIAIPSDMSDDVLVKSVTACMKVSASLVRAQQYLHPIIGRLMNIMAERPAVIESFGAKNITDFCTRVVYEKWGVHRSEAWYAKKIVNMFPDITPEEYVGARTSCLKVIGDACNWDPTDPKKYDYLKYAQDHNRDQVVEFIANDGKDVDDLTLVTLAFRVTGATRKRFNEFIYGDVATKHCETTSVEGKITRILDELVTEWEAIEAFKEREGKDFAL